MNRLRWILPLHALFFLCSGCLEKDVRLYVEADESCNSHCEGLTFKVSLKDVEEGTFTVGEKLLIEKPVGSFGKLTVTVHKDEGADSHPMKCQRLVDSQINIKELTPIPDTEVYVYYDQIMYFKNKDINIKITCKELQDVTPGSCDNVKCWNPPEDYCTMSRFVETYTPQGVCSEGECVYASITEPCWGGWCYESKCDGSLLCDGVYCNSPRSNYCKDTSTAVLHEPYGVCIKDGECKYEALEVPCPSGTTCRSGACVEQPCAGVFCNKPPASHCINNDTMRSFSVTGRCTANGSTPKCIYTKEDTICPQGCVEGACVAHPCINVTCNQPPANYCDDETVVTFSKKGYCNNGACIYGSYHLYCGNQCLEGKCGAETACIGMHCDNPPAQYCLNENTLRTFEIPNPPCVNGTCMYTPKDISCNGSCANGRCSSDPCRGVSCTTPPSDYCLDENTLMQYNPDSSGQCTGDGHCKYKADRITCEAGCYHGRC